jgi:hypothetical protein
MRSKDRLEDEELEAIAERLLRAPDAPWHAQRQAAGTRAMVVRSRGGVDVCVIAGESARLSGAEAEAAADFIAHAPTDIDRLLRERKQLLQKIRYLNAALGSKR